jgi:hypothetical protein
MPTCLYTIWQTTRARCEVLTDPVHNLTVLVWVGSSLVFQAVVSNSGEALALAADMQRIYGL